MSQMSPAMEAALAGERAIVFAAIDMDTPDRKVRLLVGGGYVTLTDSTTGLPVRYESRDDVFGVFSDIEELSDGVGNEAPSVQVTLIPPGDVETGQVSAVELQGSPFRIWLGVVDPVAGVVIGDPMLIFDGELDTATIRIDENGSRKVDYEVTSVFEEFFLANDMARLSDGFHQYLWPGELGCNNVTWVTHQIYWGTESPDGVSL